MAVAPVPDVHPQQRVTFCSPPLPRHDERQWGDGASPRGTPAHPSGGWYALALYVVETRASHQCFQSIRGHGGSLAAVDPLVVMTLTMMMLPMIPQRYDAELRGAAVYVSNRARSSVAQHDREVYRRTACSEQTHIRVSAALTCPRRHCWVVVRSVIAKRQVLLKAGRAT
nr:hypothetical protein CFP56_00727 [Quercus suber]